MIPDFVKKLRNQYGFIVNDKSVFYDKIFILVFEKEEEDCILTLNINVTKNEITFYKVMKLTATNYDDMLKECSSRKALAYPVSYELMKLVVENYDTIIEEKNKIVERRKKLEEELKNGN